MFGGIAFLLEDRMSLGVLGEDLVVRIDPLIQDQLSRYPHVRPMDFTGRPMKGFLYVGPEATKSGPGLAAWVRRGVTYAKNMPAKPKKVKK
ncbi:MAG: TfoX/Sxy family protein [Deltaproteobacteria bacterium]|nr:TfoX/Sxy family protein [Deltaproteobacteria bacterium]